MLLILLFDRSITIVVVVVVISQHYILFLRRTSPVQGCQ